MLNFIAQQTLDSAVSDLFSRFFFSVCIRLINQFYCDILRGLLNILYIVETGEKVNIGYKYSQLK